EVVERLDGAGLDRDQPGPSGRFLDRQPGLGQLDLLDALTGDGEGNRLSVKHAAHGLGFPSSPPAYQGPPGVSTTLRGGSAASVRCSRASRVSFASGPP